MPRGRLYVAALAMLLIILALNNAMLKTGNQAVAPASRVASAERPPAPDLNLPVDGAKSPVTLASLKGKVVILDLWATWCGPCRQSIPELEALYKKYHDKGLDVYGISLDDSRAPIPQAVSELGMTYPIVMGSDIPDLRSKFDFNGIPRMFVVDRRGRQADSFEGFDPDRDLEPRITQLLKE
jgi:thiol-disulfide isomerase/thioredoxin